MRKPQRCDWYHGSDGMARAAAGKKSRAARRMVVITHVRITADDRAIGRSC